MTDFDTATLSKEFVEIGGKKMAYLEIGEGDPDVILHGNPTSSYSFEENCSKRKCVSSANKLNVFMVSVGFTAAKSDSPFLLT